MARAKHHQHEKLGEPETVSTPAAPPRLALRSEPVSDAPTPLSSRLAVAARKAEREGRGAEAQCLNSALVSLQGARYAASIGFVETETGKALVAELAAL